MIGKIVIITFCVFQAVLGQDLAALEQDLQDLINQHNDEVQQYVDPLVSRIRAYSASFGDEHLRVQQDYSNLRQTLQTLGDELCDGSPDDYTCLSYAILDSFDIFRERSDDVTAFQRVGFNSLNQILNDLQLVNQEEMDLVNETQQSIRDCRQLAVPEEANQCYFEIGPEFDLLKIDILARLIEISDLGETVLEILEDAKAQFDITNRESATQNLVNMTASLTTCMEEAS